MVYIAPDGRVFPPKPWGPNSITDFFWGCVTFFQYFFMTLIDPSSKKNEKDTEQTTGLLEEEVVHLEVLRRDLEDLAVDRVGQHHPQLEEDEVNTLTASWMQLL